MKRFFALILTISLLLGGCASKPQSENTIAATTKPIHHFAASLLQGTDVEVSCVVAESVSCLHDYTLSVQQMTLLEQADAVILSGGGLEDFMLDALRNKTVIDAASGLSLVEEDPHYWLDPALAAQAAEAIAASLADLYPLHREVIAENLTVLKQQFSDLQKYADETLSSLTCRELVTFHDGFSYFAQAAELTVLASMEEEHGSETTAKDLIAVMNVIHEHKVPAVFTEVNGSVNAAQVVAEETQVQIYALDMAMGERDYFSAMKHNIDTVREALQ